MRIWRVRLRQSAGSPRQYICGMSFRRVMFWMLSPAIVIVAEAQSALYFLAAPGQLTTVLIFTSFGYVLLGSMTLNAWLALRHPESYRLRALPLHLSVVHAALYATAFVWLGSVYVSTNDAVENDASLVWVLCIPLMALSIAALVLIARRPVIDGVPIEASERLARRVGLGLGAFLVLATATAVSYLLLRTADNDGFWTFALMLPGLPWSHTLYFIIALPLGFAGGQAVVTSVLLLPLAVNVALALGLLVSPRFRTRTVNWFFRLHTVARQDADALAEDQ